MARKVITNSPNIAVLNSKIVSDLCVGKFFIDLTLSSFTSPTANQNVLGAKIKIVNPYDVAVKEYEPTYDILPPLSATYDFDIPTQSGNYQFGTFKIYIEVTDADGTKHELVENAKICQQNPKDKRVNYGNIFGTIKGICKLGKVRVSVDAPPTYQGVLSESTVQSYSLTFPTGTIALPRISTSNLFEDLLFEGHYKLLGDVCATYNYGENNYVKVPYKINIDKNIRCIVNSCAVSAKLIQIQNDLREDTCKNKEELSNLLFEVVTKLFTIDTAKECDEDVSILIKELYELIGIDCIVGNLGTPVTAVMTPSTSLAFTGCNFTQTTNGLTTTIHIDNYEYVIKVDPLNNSFVTISNGTVNNCTKTQVLNFNVAALYKEIKAEVTLQNDFIAWADIVKNGFVPTAANLLCLGITALQYAAMDYSGFWNLVLAKMCGCCKGGTCGAVIRNLTENAVGLDTVLHFEMNDLTYALDIIIDGIYYETFIASFAASQTTVFGFLASYVVTGFNDGLPHTLVLVSKCADKSEGNQLTLNFNNPGCPKILPPSLSANNIPNASCPYNLANIIQGAVPSGLTLEWHNQNNNNANSLVPNPASVSSGQYYAFYKDANGCSSRSSLVTIVCQQVGNCSEALNPLVEFGAGDSFIITHSSALYSPLSYLVKRRLFSSLDIQANYTTLGASVYNAGTNKYEYTDSTTSPNVMYFYKIESQCSDGSRPYTSIQVAKITCIEVATFPTTTTIPFSFIGVGGDVDKYIIELYDNTETTLINSIIKTPVFTNPITGTFTGLTDNTNYKIRVTPYIGAFSSICSFYSVITIGI